MQTRMRHVLGLVLGVALAAWLAPHEVRGAPGSTVAYSGRATVVRAGVLGATVLLSDAEIGETGGAADAALVNAEVPGLLTAHVLHAAVVGQEKRSHAEASVADFVLTVGGHTITAAFLMARASAGCESGPTTLSGGSEILSLAVDGLKGGALWGHLVYHDHGDGWMVKGTAVTEYSALGPTTRLIRGTCDVNGVPGTYQVVVSDQGEPGRTDSFEITLSNGYRASGLLGGGNLQLHAPRNR